MKFPISGMKEAMKEGNDARDRSEISPTSANTAKQANQHRKASVIKNDLVAAR
jgi:hypothetical protein